MIALKAGQRICTYFDGTPRFGTVTGLEDDAVMCTFEDELDQIEYRMHRSEVYAVAAAPAH